MLMEPWGSTLTHRLAWKAKLLLIGLGILLTCLAMEVGLPLAARMQAGWAPPRVRVAETAPGEIWPIYDPDLGFRPSPKVGQRNSDGLRDYPIGLKGDRFRVLLLGDSITVYGDSIDDTLVGHLRADLRKEESFPQVEIINGGVTAYTNYQELLFLEKYGLDFEPDLVGVAFCLNDLHKFHHAFQLEDGQLIRAGYFSSEVTPQTVRRSWLRRLARKSYFLAWVRTNLGLATRAAKLHARRGFSFDYNPDFSRAWKDEPWRSIESQLREFVALGQRNHFSVFLLVIPLRVQYDAEYLRRNREYVLKPQRTLREICEGLDIPFYDLYPDLTARLFLDDGIHLTKEGRQQAGRRIAAFLARSHLLPTVAPAGTVTGAKRPAILGPRGSIGAPQTAALVR